MDRVSEQFIKNLENQKILSRKELQKILNQSLSDKQSIVRLLIQKGIPRNALLKARADALGVTAWLDLASFDPEPELAKLLPKAMAIRHNLICVGKKDGKLVVAMGDPADVFAAEYVSMRTGCEIIPILALPEDLSEAIEKAYPREEPVARPDAKKQSVGTGGKEAVEEASLKEIRKGKLVSIGFDPTASFLTLARELSSTLETDRLLIKILDAARQLCDAEESSIMLYDEGRHILYFKCSSGEHGEELKQVVLPATEDSIAGWVALHREALVVNDTSADPRHYKGIDQLLKFKTRSLICVPILAAGKLYGVVEAINKKVGAFTNGDMETLSFLAGHSGVCLANAALIDELRDYYLHSVEILIAAVEALDPSFKGHMTRVARISAAISRDLGISGKTYEAISCAALLHDVGKLRITPISGNEIEKQHPVLGAEMLKDVKLMKEIVPYIRLHHERFDGSGFPEGLSGEAIPLGARIISLAENFAEWEEENRARRSIEMFIQEEGIHHDPRVLGSFQKIAQTISEQ